MLPVKGCVLVPPTRWKFWGVGCIAWSLSKDCSSQKRKEGKGKICFPPCFWSLIVRYRGNDFLQQQAQGLWMRSVQAALVKLARQRMCAAIFGSAVSANECTSEHHLFSHRRTGFACAVKADANGRMKHRFLQTARLSLPRTNSHGILSKIGMWCEVCGKELQLKDAALVPAKRNFQMLALCHGGLR